MAKINLLPRKEFEITISDGSVVRGQYGTWALKRFCDKLGYSLKDAGAHLQDPSLDEVVQYVLSAVEYPYAKKGDKCPYNDVDVCDWIDQVGGIQSAEFSKLFAHSADEDNSQEKKTEDNPLS